MLTIRIYILRKSLCEVLLCLYAYAVRLASKFASQSIPPPRKKILKKFLPSAITMNKFHNKFQEVSQQYSNL